jgi:MAE_28990/MAE_18760-like HEPN
MSDLELRSFFLERFQEVETYLSFLQEIEVAAQSGPPRIEGSDHVISAPQQKILYSGVYLQLYNLVEATVSRCLSAVSSAAQRDGRWKPEDLNWELQQEWVRVVARTHTQLTPENRLKSAVELCSYLVNKLPINSFDIEIGGGGNWDDDAIEKISRRVGCELQISGPTKTAVKRPLRDDLGALKLVKLRRNSLAHGSISFVECADEVSVSELRTMVDAVGTYLDEVIGCFSRYIEMYGFLQPGRQPSVGA